METVYSTDLDTPDVHHPNPDCPKRQEIVKSGKYRTRGIPAPDQGFAMQKENGGRRMVRSIRECRTCQTLRRIGDLRPPVAS